MAPTITVDSAFQSAKTAHQANTNDFRDLYRDIIQLQEQDKDDPNRFKTEMSQLNDRLHQESILPDFDLIGADRSSHLLAFHAGKSVDIVARNTADTFTPGPLHRSCKA